MIPFEFSILRLIAKVQRWIAAIIEQFCLGVLSCCC